MSLANLTTISRRLILQVSDEEEAATNTSRFNQTQTSAEPVEDEEKPDEFKGFSSTNRTEFETLVNWFTQNAFGGSAAGRTTIIDSFLNDWAVQWRRDQGLGDTEGINRTPTAEDLLNNGDFINAALWLPLTSSAAVPPVFESTMQTEDGEQVLAIGTADVMKGVRFIEATDTEALKQDPQTLFEVVRRTGTDLLRRARGGGVGTDDETAQAARDVTQTPNVNQATGFVTGTSPQLDLPDYVRTAILYSDPAAEGREPQAPLPSISQEDLVNRLIDTVSGGGRGGGGGGRRDFVVDRDQLMAAAREKWGRWLREAPPDERVGGIVDQYINEAGSFWRTKGGQLDFNTFLENNLKKQPRYQMIFRNLPPGTTEERFIGSFEQPISQLGLRPGLAFEQTNRALLSGGSAQGQFERVSRSREAQLQGGFSQKLARTLSGLGV